MNDSQLPEQWAWKTLEDVVDVVMGQSPPGHTYNAERVGLPFFQGKAEFGDVYPEVRKWCSSPTKLAYIGDVLLSVRAPVGPTNLALESCCIGRGLASLRPSSSMETKFVFHWMRLSHRELSSRATGSTFSAVSGSVVRSHPVPVPPLEVQREIVAAIETQFARLDAAVAALQRAKARFRRYRASVLKSACDGTLVPTEAELARRQGRDYEPASVLLVRIAGERAASPGKQRGKAKPVAPLDTSTLLPLPEGWAWAAFGGLVHRSEYGTSVKCSYEFNGPPVLRIPNMISGAVDLDDMKFASETYDVSDEDALQAGDLLVCRTNGSIGLVGRAAVVKTTPQVKHSFASYLLRFRFIESNVFPYWVASFLSSQQARRWIELNAASSAGQNNVSLSLLGGMPLPIPPLAEQRRIVDEVERRMSVIERMETLVEANLKRAESLRQSILRLAFNGKLITSDVEQHQIDVAVSDLVTAERRASLG